MRRGRNAKLKVDENLSLELKQLLLRVRFCLVTLEKQVVEKGIDVTDLP